MVGGAVGNAVTRNRVRRKLREASRTYLAKYPIGFQLTVRVHRDAKDLDFMTIRADMVSATDKLSDKLHRH